MSFLVASNPLSCTLMGWRGAGGGGVSLIGVFYFFGSALQVPRKHLLLCGFGSYSAFWLAFGVTLQQLILLARLGPQKPQAWHNLNPRTVGNYARTALHIRSLKQLST